MIKEYTRVPPESLVEDPAEFAVAHNLAGVHNENTRFILGAWRWKGLAENRDLLVPLLKQGPALDFGGHAGPVGYGAEVVDYFSETMRAPYDYPGKVKTVFTSHTLEHIPDLQSVLAALLFKIDRPGSLIVFLPSQRNVNLRKENWPHHCHTFCLESDREADWIPLDGLLCNAGQLELCKYTSDDCLLAVVSV